MFHYTVESQKTIEEVMIALEETLQREKFGLLWQLSIKDKLQEKGLDFDQDYHVLEVCNPQIAKDVLERNVLVGYFLPCKIVIYNDQGTTKIGMPRPTQLISMVQDDEVLKIAHHVEERMVRCIDGAV